MSNKPYYKRSGYSRRNLRGRHKFTTRSGDTVRTQRGMTGGVLKNQGGHERNKITEATNVEGQSLVASPRTFGNIIEDQYSIGDQPTVTRLEGGGYVKRDPLALAQIVANREQELRDRGITD